MPAVKVAVRKIRDDADIGRYGHVSFQVQR